MAQEYVVSQNANQTQMSRRSRMETFGDILRVISSGAQKPTHIMYKANLSWIVMQEYMKTLQQQGLVVEVEEKSSKRMYRLTNKGFEVLHRMQAIRDDLNLSI